MDGADVMGAETTAEQQHRLAKYEFKPGESGNPAGRPVGSRNKLSDKFCADLLEHWQEHGVEAMDAALKKDPAAYVRVVASMVPKDVKFTADTSEVLLDVLREMTAARKRRAGDSAKVIEHDEIETAH